MNSMKMNVSAQLVYHRKASRLSIEDVAEKIGVSRQAVSKWESGVTLS